MRFVFHHHEVLGPFGMEDLYFGQARFGGSVARLRLLFWLAARGHEVILTGNVLEGEHKGVRGVAGDAGLKRVLTTDSVARTALVLNNSPSEASWSSIRQWLTFGTQVILWAGNDASALWLRRAVNGEIHRVVCVSKWHKNLYRYEPAFNQVEASYSGVDGDLLLVAPARALVRPTVLSTSIPRRSKGFHNLLRAWRLVRRARPDAWLRVCGSALMHQPNASLGGTGVLDGDLEAEFPDFFGNLPASLDRAGIELMGPRPLGEVYADLKSAAVAVVNCNWRSSFETYCRAAVEAQLAGTPVVGAARGSLPEVVSHAKTGILVDKEDPAALANAVLQLLNDAALRARMKAAAPEWARLLADYELIAPDWEQIAERGWSGEPAPAERRPVDDLLRNLGYGKARSWLKQMIRKERSLSQASAQ